MQFIIKNLGSFLILLIPFIVNAQSTYLPQGNKHAALLERLEIKLQSNPLLNVYTPKPFTRRMAVQAGELADSLNEAGSLSLSATDKFNLNSMLMNNSEWVKGDKSGFAGKRSLWNTIYRNKANFFEVDQKDFFLQ